MLKNYLTVALRHLWRGKAYTAINVAGLALGVAACMLIGLYVHDEWSYDRFHRHADRLFRVVQEETAATPLPLAPLLAESLPGVVAQARIVPTLGDVLIRDTNDNQFYESRFYWADSSLLDVFSFPLLRGDSRAVLRETGSVVIAEHIARKYFGETDPIGQTLIFDVGFTASLRVTGVLKDPPSNAHFRPDFLASLSTFLSFGFLNEADWDQHYARSYLRLDRPATAERVAAALPDFLARHTDEAAGYRLQPVLDVHLRSALAGELEASGDLGYVYLFSAVALLLLLIACINFVNLTTARTAPRVREIGLRKVLGASRRRLAAQFLGESLLMAAFAVGLAVLLVYLALPLFENVSAKSFTLPTAWPGIVALLFGTVVLVGLGAGIYPALLLSRFEPAETLKGPRPRGTAGLTLRRGLVVSQFVAGIGLIAGTLVIHEQLRYIQARHLGFETEETVVVAARMYGHAATPLPFEAMQQAFAALPAVRRAVATGDVPGTEPRRAPFLLEGMAGKEEMAQTTWPLFSVDYGFVEAMGLDLVAGRSFSRASPADEGEAFVINEAAWHAAQALLGPGWEDPLGKRLDRYFRLQAEWILGKPGRVIGVVRDFHYQSLHHRVAPLVMQLSPSSRDHFLVRLRPGHAANALAQLEATWHTFVPDRPFEAYFLDEALARLYRAEQRMSTIFGFFTGLSLLIAGLGLFGLAAFSAEQRTKEIGIRKVMGASVASLVLLLARDTVQVVGLALVIATPLAYLLLARWLTAFAYHVRPSGGAFLLAGLAALGVALVAVGYQSVRASLADPVASLRHD